MSCGRWIKACRRLAVITRRINGFPPHREVRMLIADPISLAGSPPGQSALVSPARRAPCAEPGSLGHLANRGCHRDPGCHRGASARGSTTPARRKSSPGQLPGGTAAAQVARAAGGRSGGRRGHGQQAGGTGGRRGHGRQAGARAAGGWHGPGTAGASSDRAGPASPSGDGTPRTRHQMRSFA